MGKIYELKCGQWRAQIKNFKPGPFFYSVAEIFEETARFNLDYSEIVLANEIGNSNIDNIIYCNLEEILDWTNLEIDPISIKGYPVRIRRNYDKIYKEKFVD